MWDLIVSYWPTIGGFAIVIGMFWAACRQGRERRRWIATSRPCPTCGGMGRVAPSRATGKEVPGV